MSLSEKQMKDILNRYKERRFFNEKTVRLRYEEVTKQVPRIKAIDDEIADQSITISKSIFSEPAKRLELLEALKETLSALKSEKLALLEASGYKRDYLEPIYNCNKCQDTGFVDNARCTCLKQAIINEAYKQSNIIDTLEDENFKSFSLDYYSEDIDPVLSISPRENARSVYQYCKTFTEQFDQQFDNLILYGQAGLGKTFLCNSIAKALLDTGKTVVYMTSFQLFRMLETYRFHNDEDIVSYEQIDDIYTCDLLIIDDLGSEIINQFTTSELFNTLNTRLTKKKPTVISTNLDPVGWRDNYSNRIVSRIFGNYTPLKLIGSDIRLKHLSR